MSLSICVTRNRVVSRVFGLTNVLIFDAARGVSFVIAVCRGVSLSVTMSIFIGSETLLRLTSLRLTFDCG